MDKKYFSETKVKARNRAWPDLSWTYHFVHGKVKHAEELELIRSHGVEIIRFYDVLTHLCANTERAPKSGAGSDIADMIAYYESLREKIKGARVELNASQ